MTFESVEYSTVEDTPHISVLRLTSKWISRMSELRFDDKVVIVTGAGGG